MSSFVDLRHPRANAVLILLILTKSCIHAVRYRQDSRCGSDYPLPDGAPAECRVQGACCSKWGYCGITTAHCDCDGCIRYTTTIAATTTITTTTNTTVTTTPALRTTSTATSSTASPSSSSQTISTCALPQGLSGQVHSQACASLLKICVLKIQKTVIMY